MSEDLEYSISSDNVSTKEILRAQRRRDYALAKAKKAAEKRAKIEKKNTEKLEQRRLRDQVLLESCRPARDLCDDQNLFIDD